MKKLIYILSVVASLVLFVGCNDENLAEANFELFQINEVKAAAGDRAATISWSLDTDKPMPESFLLSWATSSKDVPGGSMEIAADQNLVVVSELTNNMAYTFSVQGRYSKGLSMKTSAACTPKSERFDVTDLLAASGAAKVRLTWVKPASDKLSGYRIDVMPGAKRIDISTPATERYLIEELVNGTEYEFTITAIYTNGASEGVKIKSTPGVVLPITVAATTVVKNQPVTFSYNDMFFAKGVVSSVVWAFGDTNTSVLATPTHRFAVAGTYTVTVTATYADMSTESGSLEMVIDDFRWTSRALVNGTYTGAVKASNPVFSPDGSVLYIPTSNKQGDLFAIDVYTGEIKWVYAIAGVTYGGGAAVGTDGSIYQGAQDKKMYAIKPNGTEKWTFTSAGGIENFPAITSDNKLYFGANGTKVTFYAMNATTGAVLWSKEIDGATASATAVDANGNVYVGTNMAVYSFTAAGEERWKTSEVVNVTERGSFAIYGTTLFAALKGSGGVASIDMATGAVNWRSNLATGDSYFPVVDKNGVVFFSDKGTSKVFAVNPDGTNRWEVASGSALIYAGLVLTTDGTLYVGTQKAAFKVLGINSETGALTLNETFAEQIMSSFSIGPDNRLYFGTVVGKIHARELTVGLETACWSVRGGNMQGSNSLK